MGKGSRHHYNWIQVYDLFANQNYGNLERLINQQVLN